MHKDTPIVIHAATFADGWLEMLDQQRWNQPVTIIVPGAKYIVTADGVTAPRIRCLTPVTCWRCGAIAETDLSVPEYVECPHCKHVIRTND
jgi:hypothetical protein